MQSRTNWDYEEKRQVTANIAGDTTDQSWKVAEIGWFLFENEIEYDYLQYDEEYGEVTIAHPGGLIILGPDDAPSCLKVNPEGRLYC